ncbi:MAG: cell division protein FtsK [Gammaproteobacteria bacterium 39-13]|nr:DNA translocase FtsK 4TM domain-containing protein [Gammaproteobacteria bacterium]OJV94896.1 MAG: cell division protein FtsK [Gammaproteobacteria bacterium 39-13]
MKQATTRKNEAARSLQVSRRLREGGFILLCSFAIYLLIALITYHESDPAWSHSGMSKDIHNAAGFTGAWTSDILFSLFGYMAYIFPIALTFGGVFVYRDPVEESKQSNPMIWTVRAIGLVVALAASCGLTTMHLLKALQALPMSTGGLLGSAVKTAMVAAMNPVGATVILVALFLIGVTLFTGFSWLQFIEGAGRKSLSAVKEQVSVRQLLESAFYKAKQMKLPIQWDDLPRLMPPAAKESEEKAIPTALEDDILDEPFPTIKPASKRKLKIEKVTREMPRREFEEESEITSSVPAPRPIKRPVAKTVAENVSVSEKLQVVANHGMPSLSLLEIAEKKSKQGYTNSQLQDLSRLVETRLLEFGVDAKVVGVLPGPVITRFELDLAAGIKVNKITGLAKDLARSLSVVSVRVVEVIPGKSVVGLEIPNTHRELVSLKEVLEDQAYQQATSPLTMALGKDISGRPVVVDLAKMPHLLVAGTTGSGKSVGINAMLLSILYKSSAQDIRLILIDPKMLELAVYDNIPHLLTPVVTDMKDAANALRWCVAEMERRYQLMAAVGVRNLAGYNQKVISAEAAGEPLLDPLWHPQSAEKPQPLEKLPFIVVVVDEFADMIMVVGKKVEELIARIAQKARAAGIHLILATQRPSVDVITGLIKANVPTRIAFQVSSRIDSRTILDQSGAEQLLGHGDMLYLPPGVGVPHRIHGAFVSDDEVHKVANQLRKLGKPTYIENVVQSTTSAMSLDDDDADELYDQAISIVTESRKASISLVQRRLKIGYNRAARLVERMEAEGVVSSVQSNGTREVLAPPPVEL